MFIALLYVPGHSASGTGTDALVVTVALLYVAGLSVVGTRLVRGLILRAGGSHEPIVLLGNGPDALTSAAIRPRLRLAAVAIGAIMPLAAVVVAVRVALGADPLSNTHAIASLALGVNAVIAVGVLVPAPGFTGWALLLGIVDATGARPDQRVRRAAHLARWASVPILLGAVAASAVLGDPMLMFIGLVLGLVTWSGSLAAAGEDATVRFLAAHAAGDVARPITSFTVPNEPIGDVVGRLRTEDTVIAVEADGGFLGAIGPRQLMACVTARPDERSIAAMVPLGSLRLLGPAAPAVDLLPEIARHGFAIVNDPEGLAYVEGSDLGRQIRVWVALGDRRPAKPAHGSAERS